MSGVSLHQSVVNNPAAVLGLTSTTNALSGKVSATTAGKEKELFSKLKAQGILMSN
jgi:hypothetical protein